MTAALAASALESALSYGRRPQVRARWMSTLRRLIALPTVSGSPALERAGALLAHELTAIGMQKCRMIRSGPYAPPSVGPNAAMCLARLVYCCTRTSTFNHRGRSHGSACLSALTSSAVVCTAAARATTRGRSSAFSRLGESSGHGGSPPGQRADMARRRRGAR